MTTIHLVTFATNDLRRSLAACCTSAMRYGVTDTHAFTPHMLPPDMRKRCEGQRGFGWWQWKPQVIEIAMRACEENAILVYADAGVEFIATVSHIIDRMDQDIFLFGNNWEHAYWCKRDVIEAVWPDGYRGELYANAERNPDAIFFDTSWARFGKQVQASVILFRVSDYTRQFVKEWLDWCLFEGGKLIDDSPSRLPNHPEFQEHRHDQAILTTIAYREGIRLHWWPAVYNRGGLPEFVYEKLPEYAGDDYPVLVHHHRRRNSEWERAA